MRLNRFLPWALITTFVILLLFFGVGVATYRQRSSAEGWRARTYLVLLETGAMRNGLVEAQTNLRGFLLTRDEKSAVHFERYNGDFIRSLRSTLKLVDDNREQGIRIERVQTLHAAWESAARRRIVLLRSISGGSRAGSTSVLKEAQLRREFMRGAGIADQIRILLDRIDQHERALLNTRIASATNLQSRTEKIVFGGSVFAFLALGVLAVLLANNSRELAQTSRHLENENMQRRHAESEIRAANDSLASQLARIEQRNREIEMLSECGQMLQACHNMDEACKVVRQMVPRLFPATCGAIYVLNDSGNFLERTIHWLSSHEEDDAETSTRAAAIFAEHLQLDDCWALRCGQKHRFERDGASVACSHLARPYPAVALCVPLLAQGNLLGLLHLYDSQNISLEKSDHLLVLACGEQIGLAISNLQLRETLRHQSIRDPLTNLFNRRYLEESLAHELQRATRSRQSVGVIMMDIDFFKRFNDTHGHGAGDALLQTIADCLHNGTRGGDIACRYGGEELTLILPEATRAQTIARAEELRRAVERTQIRYRDEMLGPVTLSAGVACFPEDARVADDLLKIADAALYQAKAGGRNRVISHAVGQVGSTPEEFELAVKH